MQKKGLVLSISLIIVLFTLACFASIVLTSTNVLAQTQTTSSSVNETYQFVRSLGSNGTGNGQFSNWLGGIALDSFNNVYIADNGNNRIQKFDSNGNFITKWRTNNTIDENPVAIKDIAINSSNILYVVDVNHPPIRIFDTNGNFITTWGSDTYGITVGSSDNLYVLDGENGPSKFDTHGNFIKRWGSEGEGDGQFSNLSDIDLAVDSSGNVYLVDAAYNRIQKFDNDGNFLAKWGSNGTGNGQLSYPKGIAIDASDNVYVADPGNNRIQKFDTNGNFLAKWGSFDTGEGQFDYPLDIAIDSNDNVYVADSGNSRIQVFASDINNSPSNDEDNSEDGALTQPQAPAGITDQV